MEDYRLKFKSFGNMTFLDYVKENKEELDYFLNRCSQNT